MAQINLLKQKKNSSDFWTLFTGILVKFLGAVVIFLIVYYGYLFYQAKKTNDATAKVQQQLLLDQKEIDAIPNRDELFTRQQQLKTLLGLVANHPYWSGMLPALASTTLTSANYLTFQAQNDGTMILSVTVPSTEDLDKFLQIFNLPQYNQDFYNVQIAALGKFQVGDTLMTRFDIHMQYNPALLQRQQILTPANQ